MARPLPLVLIILDGWGHSTSTDGNAIRASRPLFLESLALRFPSTLLRAAGEAVGLPQGYIGNSEVGHLCLGAGRVVWQNLTRINQSIATGNFNRVEPFCRATGQAAKPGTALHVMGLLSDGGVHSHIDHLQALVRLARERGVSDLFVHAFLDGRDTPPRSAPGYVRRVEAFLKEIGLGAIATVSGRYYAMDRDNRWDRTAKAWAAITRREGVARPTAIGAVTASHDEGINDEFVVPAVVASAGGARRDARVRDGDVVVFFNFRADRARQLTRAFIEEDKRFDRFDRGARPTLTAFVPFTAYDPTWPLVPAFPPQHHEGTLGQVLGAAGVPQLRIAETEKYAHVTYFFNGGEERSFPGEERRLIPSPKIATYDHKPEMSADEVTREVVRRIETGAQQVIILNYANADMVGHTGKYEPTVEACRVIDRCVRAVVDATVRRGGVALVTADHGNAEQMIDPAGGGPHTAHTMNDVPFYVAGDAVKGRRLRQGGLLADVAPTILGLIGIPLPKEMEGRSLFEG